MSEPARPLPRRRASKSVILRLHSPPRKPAATSRRSYYTGLRRHVFGDGVSHPGDSGLAVPSAGSRRSGVVGGCEADRPGPRRPGTSRTYPRPDRRRAQGHPHVAHLGTLRVGTLSADVALLLLRAYGHRTRVAASAPAFRRRTARSAGRTLTPWGAARVRGGREGRRAVGWRRGGVPQKEVTAVGMWTPLLPAPGAGSRTCARRRRGDPAGCPAVRVVTTARWLHHASLRRAVRPSTREPEVAGSLGRRAREGNAPKRRAPRSGGGCQPDDYLDTVQIRDARGVACHALRYGLRVP